MTLVACGKLFRLLKPQVAVARAKHKYPKQVRDRLDYSKVPEVDFDNKKLVTEKAMTGSGPGGQAVAKTNNCISLTHVPTGVIVKCHESRSLSANRETARMKLKDALDNFYNGEDSVDAQANRISKELHELGKDSRKGKREQGILKRLREKEAKLLEKLEFVTDNKEQFLDPHQKVAKLQEQLIEVRRSIDEKSDEEAQSHEDILSK